MSIRKLVCLLFVLIATAAPLGLAAPAVRPEAVLRADGGQPPPPIPNPLGGGFSVA
ncbi:MAG: hypothetical protein L0338_01925 [Acidobacteria bacterium]|nr:hypothetical protein [Acidobacteriota bacterium]